MLVLSRRVDQRIRIGDDIEVVVLGIEGDHVKLGIQAPRHIRVLRHELLVGVQEENRLAAAAAAAPLPIDAVLTTLTTPPAAPAAPAAGDRSPAPAVEVPLSAVMEHRERESERSAVTRLP